MGEEYMNQVKIPSEAMECLNFSGGQWQKGSGSSFEIISPYNNQVIGKSTQSSSKDVDFAATQAQEAFLGWSSTSLKERSQIMFNFRNLLLRDIDKISNCVSSESGKTLGESKAGLLKGIEVLEFALSLQNLDQGGKMEVSKGVFCEYRREALGVVAGITPFNFPAMVPMWMIPISLTLGNSFIWKPSDKTPLTSFYLAEALNEAGLPKGVFSVLQGGQETVEALIDHPIVKAIGFVGSSHVAKQVYLKSSQNLKRALALGGAKNHIFLMPDASAEITTQGIADSFTGCAGQRCMAASVLLAVGDVDHLIHEIKDCAQKTSLGDKMGAIITKNSHDKLVEAISQAEKEGAKIILDGRSPQKPQGFENGNWLAPTIIDNVKANSQAACDELFGPVLSIIRCTSLSEALAIENSNPYGNAASVFTQDGRVAEKVVQNAKSGMVGVNIGVPVPREPFSFGGFYESKYGYGDITGHSSLDFWTRKKKVTVKWSAQADHNWMS